MSFGFFLNMEKLSLDIAKTHISNMTNNNMFDDIFLDNDKLINNLHNGFVVITQLNTFFESFLNTILDKCIGYNGEALLKASIPEKIEIIFMYYKKDFSIIKSQHPWEVFRKVTKVRNEMIHFKKTNIGQGSGIPDFNIGGIRAKDFFTKDNMEHFIHEIIALGDSIATELNLKVEHDINIFECDAVSPITSYIHPIIMEN